MSTQEQDFQWTDELVNEYVSRIVTGTLGFQHNHMEKFKEEKGEKRSPEYEVLSYRSKLTDLIISVAAHQPDQPISPLYAIHSVKRLSDGEVFQVGDEIDPLHGEKCRITGFEVNKKWEGSLMVRTDEDENSGVALKYITKLPTPTPLFRTEDGVDIYEENVVLYGVSAKGLWAKGERHFSQIQLSESMKWFANEYNRDRYILLNKPLLSINEVINAYDTNSEEPDQFLEALNQLAKEKL